MGWRGFSPPPSAKGFLTITAEAIRVEPVASIAATIVGANIVVAILLTVVSHSFTLHNIITSEAIHVETIASIAAASIGA